MTTNSKPTSRTLRSEDIFSDLGKGSSLPKRGETPLSKAERLILRGYLSEIADANERAELIASKVFKTHDTTLEGKPKSTPLFREFVNQVAILVRLADAVPETD